MAVLDYALGYLRIGWWVLPLKENSKVPESRLVPNGVRGASNDVAVVRDWFTRFPNCNIGVAMLSSGLVGIDVDPRNGGFETLELVESIHGSLESDVSAFTGGGGFHRVFSSGLTNLPGTLGKGIDVKADGYLVVEPSIHPNGTRYEWEASSNPLEGSTPSALPSFIRSIQPNPIAESSVTLERFVTDEQMLEVKEALGYIDPDDYHTWIAIGQALRSMGAAGFGLWDTWSQRSEKYDAAVMGKKWRGFKPTKINLESIFFRAQQNGWVNPLGSAAAKRNQALLELAHSEAQIKRYEVKAVSEQGVQPFPVPMLDEVCGWICHTQGIKNSVAVQMTAISMASLAASRLYTSEYGDGAHLYQMLCAPSSGELSPLVDSLAQIMRDAGLRKLLREQRITSPSALYKALMRAPATLWVASDWGAMTAFAKRQSTGYVELVQHLITSCYTQKDISLDNPEELGLKMAAGITNDMPTIRRPALSILGITSDAMLANTFSVQELGRGAVEQFLFHNGRVVPDGDGIEESTPAWLVSHLRRIRKLPDSAAEFDLASIFNGNAEFLPMQAMVRFDAKPVEHYPTFDALCEVNRTAQPLARAARTHLRRLALTLAVYANPEEPVVNRAILDWSAQFVRDRITESMNAMNLMGGSEDGKASMYQVVLQSIAQAADKGCTTSELVRSNYRFRAMNRNKREELLAQLIEDGAVVEQKNSNNKGCRMYAAEVVSEVNPL